MTQRPYPAFRLRPGNAAAILLTALAAIIIGCGGGGGGGGSTGSSATATATTATATATTATATATTATATATTATATATTATATATTATATAGMLPKNKIFFSRGLGDGSTEYLYVSPTAGASPVTYATLPLEYQGLGLDPTTANRKVFGYQPAGESAFGIYSNTTISPTGATRIVAPTYATISQIQVSPDAALVYFIASSGLGADQLYRVPFTGGTPALIDVATSFHLNPAGTKVVYAKLTGGDLELFVKNADGTGSATQITNNTSDDQTPQWNHAGTKIVFSSLPSTAAADLYTVNPDGTGLSRLTNTADQDESGPSFNEDGTAVAFANFGSFDQYGILTQTIAGGTRTNIVLDPSIGATTYWSTAGGRSAGSAATLGRRKRER